MTGIKAATFNDVQLLGALAHQIWPKVYDYMISEEQINYMLTLIYSEDALLKQIQNGQRFAIYYDNDIPFGFTGFGMEPNEPVFKLHKLYLDPSLQGKGIGLLLLDYVIAAAKATGANTLRLNVNKHNKTISFYKKYGFEITKEVFIDIGGGFVMDDYVMEREL